MSRKDVMQVLFELKMNGEMSVTELWIATRRKYHSDVCQVLTKLKKCKIVKKRRKGKEIYYSIKWSRVALIKDVTDILNENQ